MCRICAIEPTCFAVSFYLSGSHQLIIITTYITHLFEFNSCTINSKSQASFNSVPPNSLKFQWPTSSNIISDIVNDALLGGFLAITASPVGMTVSFIKAGPPSLLSTQSYTVLYTKNILPRV